MLRFGSGRLLFLVAALCFGCASDVRVEYDEQEDFGSYATWRWLSRTPERYPPRRASSELHGLFAGALVRELSERGFRFARRERPDFYVAYQLEVEREVVRGWRQSAVETVPNNSGGAAPGSSPEISASERIEEIYEDATLLIDIAEGDEKQLVWRGTLKKRVLGSFGAHMDAAVAELLAGFPPAAED